MLSRLVQKSNFLALAKAVHWLKHKPDAAENAKVAIVQFVHTALLVKPKLKLQNSWLNLKFTSYPKKNSGKNL